MIVNGIIQINSQDTKTYTYVRDVVKDQGVGGTSYQFSANLGEFYLQQNAASLKSNPGGLATFTNQSTTQIPGGVTAIGNSSPNVWQYTIRQQGIGSQWIARTTIPTASVGWNAIAYGAGTWVVVGQDATNSIATSTNLVTFTQVANTGVWLGVKYYSAFGLFIAVGNNTTNGIASSPTGAIWTNYTTPSAAWNASAYSPTLGVLAVAGSNTTNSILTSQDAVTWTAQTTPSAVLTDIVWSSYWNKFIAVGTNTALTSSNGTTWTAQTVPASNWNGLIEGSNGLLVAVSLTVSASSAMYSVDGGTTWIAAVTPNAAWQDVYFQNNQFFAVGTNGSSAAITSFDGITWTAQTTASAVFRGIAGDGFRVAAVGGTNALTIAQETGGYLYGDYLTIVNNFKNTSTTNLVFPESYGPTDTIARIQRGNSKLSLVNNVWTINRASISSIIMVVNASELTRSPVGNSY